jgi:hypothetical protein
MTSEMPPNSQIVKLRDMMTGKINDHIFTTLPRPNEAWLQGYCYDCRKWTWIVGVWCAECNKKLFFG